jgi:hypothetical protein
VSGESKLTFCDADPARLFRSLGLNELKGTIPREIGKLTRLEYLLLGINGLNGTIPSEMGRLTGLQIL